MSNDFAFPKTNSIFQTMGYLKSTLTVILIRLLIFSTQTKSSVLNIPQTLNNCTSITLQSPYFSNISPIFTEKFPDPNTAVKINYEIEIFLT